MSAHKTPEINEAELRLDEPASKIMKIAGAVGVIGLILSFIIGNNNAHGENPDHWAGFMYSYLVAFSYWLSICLGCLFFVTLQHLVKAGWSVVVRRLAEFIASAVPVLFILFLPILIPTLMGSHVLYHWTDPALLDPNSGHFDHLMEVKEPYLNIPFFLVRCLFYFLFWTVLSQFMFRQSMKQDIEGGVKHTNLMQLASAPSMLVLALTTTFAVVDFIMSLQFHWFSTIIGVYFFAGAMMSTMSVLVLVSRGLQANGYITKLVNVEHYHDLGKLMFAFVFFWGYIAFSQFMLIWYANMPEGTQFYLPRQQGEWVTFMRILIIGHFFIPFPGLISRHAKRRLKILTFWAVYLLIFQYIDLYYMIMPARVAHGDGHGADPEVVPLSLLDLTCWIGVGGIFVAAVAYNMRGKQLAPTKDPRFAECMAHENI